MNILIFFIISVFVLAPSSYAQNANTSKCKCQYYSGYNLKEYRKKADSLGEIYNKKYGNFILIGQRNFSTANLLFIVRSKNTYRGIFRDLKTRKLDVITGSLITQMARKILADTIAIRTNDSIPREYVNHDLSFIVSFGRRSEVYEICYSQILGNKNSRLAKLLIFYKNNFN